MVRESAASGASTTSPQKPTLIDGVRASGRKERSPAWELAVKVTTDRDDHYPRRVSRVTLAGYAAVQRSRSDASNMGNARVKARRLGSPPVRSATPGWLVGGLWAVMGADCFRRQRSVRGRRRGRKPRLRFARRASGVSRRPRLAVLALLVLVVAGARPTTADAPAPSSRASAGVPPPERDGDPGPPLLARGAPAGADAGGVLRFVVPDPLARVRLRASAAAGVAFDLDSGRPGGRRAHERA